MYIGGVRNKSCAVLLLQSFTDSIFGGRKSVFRMEDYKRKGSRTLESLLLIS